MPARWAILVVLAATSASAASASEAAVASARVRPDWSVTVGGGVLSVPSYPGASSTKRMAVPFLEVKYREVLFLSSVAGLGFNAIASRRVRAGVAVLPELGRSESSSDRLRGMGDLGAGLSIQAFGRYSLGPVAWVGDVRRQVGAGDGTLVGAGVTTMVPLGRRAAVMPTIRVTWANGRHARAYFGVDDRQSSAASSRGSTLPVYPAGGGLRDAGLTLAGRVLLDDRWSVQWLVRTDLLLGDAAGSPLAERRFQAVAGALLAYRL